MNKQINLWKNHPKIDKRLKEEMDHMSEAELIEAFYEDISFGTGGLRGILGAGTNRMNIYTIRKSTLGYARYLTRQYPHLLLNGVVIAYDCRHYSKEFAKEAARVFASLGIKVYVFESLRPTPEISFAIRHLNCIGGAMITASHNPPNYNGYKVYDPDGCQLIPELADMVIKEINAIEHILDYEVPSYESLVQKSLIELIGDDIDQVYLERVKSIQINRNVNHNNVSIVFTPLHGTASVFGASLLSDLGYQVYPVKEQMQNDPNFSTVKSPNPEEPGAFDLAIKLGTKVNADILLATDPDADRLGVAIRNDQADYKLLNGNQIGALILYYLAQFKHRTKKGIVFNTIVSSNIASYIANSYDLEVQQTLTGFKYIGEQAKKLENAEEEFFFGYEESHGYVIADFVRDKDAFQAMVILAEIAAYYKKKGKSLLQILDEIYQRFGYFVEIQHSMNLSGIEGTKRIELIMNTFQHMKLDSIANQRIVMVEDFELSKRIRNGQVEAITLPKSKVLKYTFEDGGWCVLRPSGTEPKMKVYVSCKGTTWKEASDKVALIKEDMLNKINQI